MTKLSIMALLLAVCSLAIAEPDTLRVSRSGPYTYLTERAVVVATNPATTYAQATAQTGWQSLRKDLPTSARRAWWLRTYLHNDTDSAQTFYVQSADNQIIDVFLNTPGHAPDSLRFGAMVPTSAWPVAESEQYAPLRLLPRRTYALTLRVGTLPGWLPRLTTSDLPRPALNLRLDTERYHDQRVLRDRQTNAPEWQYRTWVQGALLFFALLVGLLYAYDRQRIYRYYGLYVLAGATYALLKTRSYTPLGHLLGELPLLKTHWLEGVLWAGWGAYVYFLIALLDLDKTHPAAARRMGWAAIGAVAYAVLYTATLMLTNDGGLQQVGFWASRAVFVSLHVGILVWVVQYVPSSLTRYVLVGNLLLVSIGVLAALRAGGVILKGVTLGGYVDNLLMMSLGVLLEVMVFGVAMAHRFRLIEQHRQQTQLAYVEEVEQRTAYEKRLAEVEMLALRSQMNPHFLFNCLNTIEYFVLKGDEARASRYLSSFSQLLRLILNHANEDAIRLADELKALNLYLELEASRFDEGFRYTIEIDATLDPNDVMVPPLLLQPYVENAIRHGLLPSPRPDKRLWVRVVSADSGTLHIELEDNGIGRAEAERLKSQSALRHRSFGMQLTQQRIDLFNRNFPAQVRTQLIDLQTNGQTGTLVRITYRHDRHPA